LRGGVEFDAFGCVVCVVFGCVLSRWALLLYDVCGLAFGLLICVVRKRWLVACLGVGSVSYWFGFYIVLAFWVDAWLDQWLVLVVSRLGCVFASNEVVLGVLWVGAVGYSIGGVSVLMDWCLGCFSVGGGVFRLFRIFSVHCGL